MPTITDRVQLPASPKPGDHRCSKGEVCDRDRIHRVDGLKEDRDWPSLVLCAAHKREIEAEIEDAERRTRVGYGR